MATESLVETIKRELPGLLREDPGLRNYLVELTRDLHADRDETARRFDRVLDERRRDREEQAREWDEYAAERKARSTSSATSAGQTGSSSSRP